MYDLRHNNYNEVNHASNRAYDYTGENNDFINSSNEVRTQRNEPIFAERNYEEQERLERSSSSEFTQLTHLSMPTSNENVAFLELFRGGERKSGTERDVLISNLLKGTGSAFNAFAELQRNDRGAFLVCRDETLKRIERKVMSAFCALTISTSNLRQPSREVLNDAYVHVKRLRQWLLSRRQEAREQLDEIESKAALLCKYDNFMNGSDVVSTSASSVLSSSCNKTPLNAHD